MNNLSQFIATEPLDNKGEAGEKIVWDAIKIAFRDRICLGYWRYPIFSTEGKFRKEPDILIADRKLGLIIIEVKSINIEQIVSISGHLWRYQNFYTDRGNPYQQAENQLYGLLAYSDREPILKNKITARAMISLPYITREQWQAKGFDKLPNNPPILFKNNLLNISLITDKIAQTATLKKGDRLTATQWQLLLAILGGTPLYAQDTQQNFTTKQSKGKIIQQARSRLHQLDLKQEKIAKQIPPGMQRIRGIAGSGKTVLLCQKAAIMHVKYPQWRIALVFFSRSLYEPITQQIDKWIGYFSQEKQKYEPEISNLKILHAWGSRKQAGFYSTLCKLTGIKPLNVNNTYSKKPNEALAEVCLKLLESTAIPQVFDAILIDEGQDLIVDNWHYQDKQPFYWLAYQALRPVNPVHPEQKRLIWTYDELQSLASLNIPNTCELFGEELGHLVTGQYADEINKTEIISRCYRTPQQIIIVAHAIAMGLYRKAGMLTGSIYPEEWQALGYKVTGNFNIGEEIILQRDRDNSPNLIGDLWPGNVIQFNKFFSRQQELTALADNLKYNLQIDEVQPDRDILVIILGSFYDAANLEKTTANFLIKQGINIYLPTHKTYNTIHSEPEEKQGDRFWYPGTITISTIHRAKGQEADIVYLIGLDNIAKNESDLYLRNQLFVALTRSKGWVNISGISNYPLYEELEQIIATKNCLKFTFTQPPQRNIKIGDRAELLQGFALGRTNFRYANLPQAELPGVHLANINLIGANLSGANLENAYLVGAKLISADLSNANLSNANLSQAKLIGANLTNTNLTNTNLTNADLTNTILDN